MKPRPSWIAWLGGSVVFLALQGACGLFPALAQGLAGGAARLAAGLLGVPLEGGVEPVLAHPDYPVQVVAACSGWDFFSLLGAVLVARALAGPRGARARNVFLALPVAALIAVVTNAGRLAAVLGAGRFVLPHLPTVAAVPFHTALGVAMFLPVLIISCLVWERRVCHV